MAEVPKEKPMKHFSKLLILLFFLSPSFAVAEVKEIIAEGTYNMGDGETPTVAESRALLQAKRVAIEQAGTYIESYSKVKNFQLTHDEIQVLASGVMEVTILDKKRTIVGDGVNFWVKIKAKVSTDKIDEMARKVKEKSVVEDYKRLQQDYEKLGKEMELLKKQLKEAKSGSEKKQVEANISDSERLFQANEWFEKGRVHILNKEYDDAIEAFNRAIAINPDYNKAYHGRGVAYSQKLQYDRAIEDFNRVIAIDPNFAPAYEQRGLVYNDKAEYDKALKDFNKVITLDPNRANSFVGRGLVYTKKGKHDRAISDFQKACSLGYELGCESFAMAYFGRGLANEKKGQTEKAIADFQKACDLGSEMGCKALKKLYGITANNPDEAYICVMRGVDFFQKKEFDKAIKEFTNAINLKSRYAAAYYDRACAYLAKSEYQKAINDFTVAVVINPKYVSAYFNRGIAHEKEGQIENAKADFQRACSLGDEDGCKKEKIPKSKSIDELIQEVESGKEE